MEVAIGLISGMNSNPNSNFLFCNNEYNVKNILNNREFMIMKNNKEICGLVGRATSFVGGDVGSIPT